MEKGTRGLKPIQPTQPSLPMQWSIFNCVFNFQFFNFSIFTFLRGIFNFQFSFMLSIFNFSIFQFSPYYAEVSIFNFQFQFSRLKSRNLTPLAKHCSFDTKLYRIHLCLYTFWRDLDLNILPNMQSYEVLWANMVPKCYRMHAYLRYVEQELPHTATKRKLVWTIMTQYW